MRARSGEIVCQGAVFIYKDDTTTERAWHAARGIGDIRREVHGTRAHFLDGLRRWAAWPTRDPSNAFLAIYAHMGDPGISPKGGDDHDFDAANIISWDELGAALNPGLETLWLVGCDSKASFVNTWKPGPVRGYILATKDSQLWLPLLPLFGAEISLENIRRYREMPAFISGELSAAGLEEHAKSIQYYRQDGDTWCSFP